MTLHALPIKREPDPFADDPAAQAEFVEWCAIEAVKDLIASHGKTKAALVLSTVLEDVQVRS